MGVAAPDGSPLAVALAAAPGLEPEERLLTAAALAAAYESCGARPPRSEDGAPVAAAEDDRPACPSGATDLLGRLLSLPNAAAKQQLVGEWLAGAASRGWRVPHGSLSALFDYGVLARDLRDAIGAAGDRRGQWLTSMNPRWQFAAAGLDDPTDAWATGARERRVAALRQLRASDPARGRALVEQTWREDGADERASFLGAMAVGLTAEDEPFLEAALDDRSKQVRAAAADLLARSPASALVGRMTARADALATFTPAAAGGLLRKGKPASAEFTLPPEPFDPAWARDGVIEKPPHGTGRRQWWLSQILAAVPPSHWSAAWRLAPEACVAAATGDDRPLVLDAWSTAAVRFADAAWAAALLAESLTSDVGRPRVALVEILPVDAQQAIVAKLLRSAAAAEPVFVQLFAATRFQFDAATAEAVFARLDALVVGAAPYRYQIGSILEALALRLPPETPPEALLKRWSGPAWEMFRGPLDRFLQTLQLRRDILAEFAR